MKHKNIKQYEEKNAPKLNHDITLEEIEAACRAHQKENDNRNMAEECRAIAREQKEKMQAQFTKGKGEKRHILLRLGRYLWQFKGWLFLAILLSISSNLLSLAGPMYSGYAVDAMVGKGQVNMERVIYCCEIMIALYLVSAALAYILNLVMLQITKRIVSTMRSNIFDRLMRLPVSFFDTHAAGDIISRITYDVDTINTSLSNDVVSLDDSSSALDYATDARLRRAIQENYGDLTSIIVAQRISSIYRADKIIVLEDGEMIGYGTHKELMESCEVYREISQSQMGGGIDEA